MEEKNVHQETKFYYFKSSVTKFFLFLVEVVRLLPTVCVVTFQTRSPKRERTERKRDFTKFLLRKILFSYSFWMSTAHWVKAISAGCIINWPHDLQNGYDHVIWDMYLHDHLSLFKNVMVLNIEGVFWSHQSCSLVKQYCWIDI